jgi:endonuclease/exonuclease/phosphatase family metal-dependent hydrolase
MATIRVATFNCENLFARFKFNKDVDPNTAVPEGWDANRTHFTILNDEEKRITAAAIKETKADILALQEVENLDTLKRFRNQFLGGRRAYPHVFAVDGNDPRLIDVAVLSKLPIVHGRSYQHLLAGRQWLFSRDCLEVDVELPGGGVLTVFVNHLKSMLDKKEPCKGRARTRAARQRQAQAVRDIVTARFGSNPGGQRFVVLGDLNDYLEADAQGTSGIVDLVEWDAVVNVVDRLDPDERWTHFFKGNSSCGLPPAYRQLDYVLVSQALAGANPGAPVVVRKGLPLRADRYSGPRFDGVGKDKLKASDHCPVLVSLDV